MMETCNTEFTINWLGWLLQKEKTAASLSFISHFTHDWHDCVFSGCSWWRGLTSTAGDIYPTTLKKLSVFGNRFKVILNEV